MKNAKHLQFTLPNLDVAIENQVTLSTNASLISAKDRPFADSESPQSLVQYQFSEPKEDLWQSILKLKSVSSQRISPKFVDTMPVEIFPDDDVASTSKFRSSSYVKWRRLILIAECVQRFKNKGIERIASEAQLRRSMSSLQTVYKKQMENYVPWIMADDKDRKAIHTFRDRAFYYEALERGTNEDIKYIREYLIKDPRNYLNDPELPDRRANMPNRNGYTPLYIACKNGNIQLLGLLLEFKANPNQLSNVSLNEKESILSVAVRWGHVEIVRLLTESRLVWPQDELAKVYGKASNLEIKNILKSRIECKKSKASV